MRKATKKKAGGRKCADSEIQNDEVIAQSTQEEIQPLSEEKENENENEIGGELAKVNHEDEAKGAHGKRKRISKKETENNDGKKSDLMRPKRARATNSKRQEYFEEKRNLEDLWKSAYPAGLEVYCHEEYI